MKGLFLKDWYCTVKQCKSCFIIDVVFFTTAIFGNGNPFFLIFPCLTSGLLAMTLISYEESDAWNKYAATLPYTKAEIVSSKYILGLLNAFTVGSLATIVLSFSMIRLGTFDLRGSIFAAMLLFSIGLISSAMLNPFIYKFGVVKGRIAYYLLVGGTCGLTTAQARNGAKLSAALSGMWIAPCIITAVLLLYGISWLLSIHFYKKREL